MDAIISPVAEAIIQVNSAATLSLAQKCEQMIQLYWDENPELYQLVQQKKQAQANDLPQKPAPSEQEIAPVSTAEIVIPPILTQPLRGAELRALIQESYREIRQHVLVLNADIVPRTQASNKKSEHQSLEEEQAFRAEVVAAQIQSWRSLLPKLIRKFSKISDVRRAKSVKHKNTVLMMFGLFAFIFRLSSRREMNRELTGPVIFENLLNLFPELISIPHADTLARFLETVNPKDIEAIHIILIRDLINKKKFTNMLIYDCLPITIDGTQKLYRDGLLQDPQWCERVVGPPEAEKKQQYVYVLEANITLKNGLTIPLMTEYLYRETNQLINLEGKQDSETTAFERLAARLKEYFPRLKLMFFMDAMYATQSVMGLLHENNWQYIISLPKNKLKDFAETLNEKSSTRIPIPGQLAYRKRKQEFYWENNIPYGYEWQLTVHLVACLERYEEVDKKTGEIVESFSEHAWISSIRIDINNVHELLNQGARKKELIEDSINTEKNRGYQYKHLFSYNWTAMQGFHYLMRLGHAINAISEFTKKLKQHIKDRGNSATLKIIKETLFAPWLSTMWYARQRLLTPRLRLQLE